MTRDSFVFYRSFLESIADIPKDAQSECLSALMQYALNGIEPEIKGPYMKLYFTLVKPQIDANNQKLINGKKGGRKKKSKNQTETEKEPGENQTETEKEPSENQTETETERNVNVNDNANANANDSDNESVYIKHAPTKEQVNAYFKDIGMSEDEASRFYDYNQTRGWKAGKNPIKDWKAAARTWKSRQKDFPSGSAKARTGFNNFGNQQDYGDFGELENLLHQ